MTEKKIDVSALCLFSKLNIGEGDRARIEEELCEFAEFAAVLDSFSIHDMSAEVIGEGELREDKPKNLPSETSGSYIAVPLTLKGAQDD